jgi:hypothetical protein
MLTVLASLLLARPLVLAHYMPWYESKSFSGQWGWHWTMNHFDPDRGSLASKYRPLIGPYDSDDPAAVECECQLMKLSGIDGVLIDWYGIADLYDYRSINRNTELLIRTAQKVGLKFGIVYEDQTLLNLIKAGKVHPEGAVDEGTRTMRWLESNYFKLPGYLTVEGRPVLLVFGPQFFKDRDWERMFAGLATRPAFFTELGKKAPAVGAFGWPEPQAGDQGSWSQLDAFYDRARSWTASIAVAYPRFDDIYSQAGIHPSWGTIDDRDGSTYRRTMSKALASGAPFVQIATWNDWGEGTQIEPSAEFGNRDLEATQSLTRAPFSRHDLRLPVRLYTLRKRLHAPKERQRLDKIGELIDRGETKQADRELSDLETRS